MTELPLNEPTFMVLLSIAREPKHGYAILKDVAAFSDRRVVLSTGTLYGALQRLSEAGWVRKIAPEGGDRRRGVSYTLTARGRNALTAECGRMQSLVRLGRRHLACEAAG